MSKAHEVVRDLEDELCHYTGAKYAVTTNSCTMALLLALAWHRYGRECSTCSPAMPRGALDLVEIPCRTYVSVPMAIMHAGMMPRFRDEIWWGAYQLWPFPIWDSARRFTGGMYQRGQFQCVSFHATKILSDTQGGAILHDDPAADRWLRKARFDGRTEGIEPRHDHIDMLGWHCYMSPDVAARLLHKLQVLPEHNRDLPADNYPDLSTMEIFQ